jgi:putative transposase
MARRPRIVASGCPHHVTARGNRREPIFFEDGDQEVYRDLLAEQMVKASVAVWAYCLMPNHVHLILCPSTDDGLGKAIGAAHRKWASFVNARGRWHGHLFDSRFASVVMDEAHLISAVRYVALNPVRAGLVARAEDWPWSSVRAHLVAVDDGLVTVKPVLDRMTPFEDVIRGTGDDATFAALRAAELTGRALGTAEFVRDLERRLGRPIARRAAGRKPRANAETEPEMF